MPAGPENHWKKSLLILPDDVFFALMRNYLGGIRTPFNKHNLIERLSRFLRKPEIQDRIITLLDEEDRIMLTSIGCLESVSPEDLCRINLGRIPYASCLHLISSLTERLLIFTEGTGDPLTLRINPLLLESFRERVFGFRNLFRCRPGKASGKPLWLDEGLLTGFASYLLRAPESIDEGGIIRKRDLPLFRTVFPGLKVTEGLSEEAGLAIRSLDAAGVLTWKEKRAYYSREAFEYLLDGPPWKTKLILYASAVFGSRPEDINLLVRILFSFPEGIAIHPEDFERFILICSLRETESFDTAAAAGDLIRLGVFYREKDGFIVKNPSFRAESFSYPAETAEPVFQPNFDLVIPKDSRAKTLGIVPALFRLRKLDRFLEFAMDQECFVGYLESGGTADDALTGIMALTGKEVPQNISSSLRLWEQQFRSVRLYQGAVIQVAEEMRPFLEHSPHFSPLIRETIAPGIYFLGNIPPADLRDALQKTGISHPPGNESFLSSPAWRVDWSVLPEPRESQPLFPPGIDHPAAGNGEPAFIHDLKESLKTADIPEGLKKEFSNRIQRKLILREEQFSRDIEPAGRKEAKGLDYFAKVRLIEEAISSGNSLLEIPEGTGSQEMMVVKPLSLRKDEGDCILTGRILPGGTEKEFSIRKTLRIRRLSGYLVPSIR